MDKPKQTGSIDGNMLSDSSYDDYWNDKGDRMTKQNRTFKEKLLDRQLQQYWVDEESPYIHHDKVVELVEKQATRARIEENKTLHNGLRLVVDNHGVLELRERVFNHISELERQLDK